MQSRESQCGLDHMLYEFHIQEQWLSFKALLSRDLEEALSSLMDTRS